MVIRHHIVSAVLQMYPKDEVETKLTAWPKQTSRSPVIIKNEFYVVLQNAAECVKDLYKRGDYFRVAGAVTKISLSLKLDYHTKLSLLCLNHY